MVRSRIKKGNIDFKYNFKLYFSFIKKYKCLEELSAVIENLEKVIEAD